MSNQFEGQLHQIYSLSVFTVLGENSDSAAEYMTKQYKVFCGSRGHRM